MSITEGLLRLGTSTWGLWPIAVLRSAGFPAKLGFSTSDDALLAAADAAETDDDERFQDEFENAKGRHVDHVSDLAQHPRLREAVAWQNPEVLSHCFDPLAAGYSRNSRNRNRERTLVSYAKRYALKNDTISFFGPVSWCGLSPGMPSHVKVEENLIRGRKTHWESWAVDLLASTMSSRIANRTKLPVRRSPGSAVVDGQVRTASGRILATSDLEREVFALADPGQTVETVAARAGIAPAEVLEAAGRLADRKVLHLGFEVPVSDDCLGDLHRQLVAAFGPADAESLVAFERLVDLTGVIGGVTDDEQARIVYQQVHDAFTDVTGSTGTRRAGQTYAGRTLLYQEAIRGVDVTLGDRVWAAMAPTMPSLLQGADWIVAELTRRMGEFLTDWVAKECVRTGVDSLPLGYVLMRNSMAFTEFDGQLPPIAEQVKQDFQERWIQILDSARPGEAGVEITPEELAERTAELFAVPGAAPRFTRVHSPDVIVDAASPEALARGDVRLVLGELHVGVNTLDARAFVQQFDDKMRLSRLTLAAAGPRVIVVPVKESPYFTSRAAPPCVLGTAADDFLFIHDGHQSIETPSRPLAATELVARIVDGRLTVISPGSGRMFDWWHVLADFLSSMSANLFHLAPQGSNHVPRVTCDRVVLRRETWRFEASEIDWVDLKGEDSLYWHAARWRRAQGLPDKVFVNSVQEVKPLPLDFSDLSSLGVFTLAVRKLRQGGAGTVTLSELLPDGRGYWLTDSAGDGYTSEVRMLASRVDGWR